MITDLRKFQKRTTDISFSHFGLGSFIVFKRTTEKEKWLTFKVETSKQ